MNLWFRIWKTVELIRKTAWVIWREIFRYYFNAYIIIRILQLVSGLSRRIRQVWLTKLPFGCRLVVFEDEYPTLGLGCDEAHCFGLRVRGIG